MILASIAISQQEFFGGTHHTFSNEPNYYRRTSNNLIFSILFDRSVIIITNQISFIGALKSLIFSKASRVTSQEQEKYIKVKVDIRFSFLRV